MKAVRSLVVASWWFVSLISCTLFLSSAQAQEYVPGEVIVKLKGSSKTMKSQAFIGKAVSEKSMSLKGSYSGLNMHHFKLGAAQNLEQTLQELRADPDVEYAEPNYILRKPEAVGSLAVGSGEKMSMDDLHAQVGTSGAVGTMSAVSQTNAPIQLANAWSVMSASATPPVVAIIDTGVDMNHTIFVNSGAIWTNSGEIPGNGIDDDGNGYIDDVHGWNFVANNNSPMDDDNHGTHVAGIVLGTTQDITAATMQPAAIRIMPLKFLDSQGSGTTSDAVRAIYYAVNNGARVLNNSWGGGGFSNSLQDAIAYAYSRRVVFVAAAGNASSNNDVSPTYPANYSVPGLVSVAATTDADGFASFSNYGLTTVHVGSPGSGIWSSLPNNFYGRASGTSMATPFVSGMAALMVRENSALSAYQVKTILFGGAQSIASLQTKTSTHARINVYNSILSAKTTAGASDQPAFSSSARETASVPQVAGCGLIKAIVDDASGPSGPQKNIAFFGMVILFLAPLVIAVMLRQASGKSRRRFPRYQIASTVRLKIGDKELVGNVNSISMGGVSLQTDEWLENGGVVTMSIRSPDGREEIQVGGKVVWSEEQKRYGVAFEGADSSVLNSIARWTAGLLKAS